MTSIINNYQNYIFIRTLDAQRKISFPRGKLGSNQRLSSFSPPTQQKATNKINFLFEFSSISPFVFASHLNLVFRNCVSFWCCVDFEAKNTGNNGSGHGIDEENASKALRNSAFGSSHSLASSLFRSTVSG